LSVGAEEALRKEGVRQIAPVIAVFLMNSRRYIFVPFFSWIPAFAGMTWLVITKGHKNLFEVLGLDLGIHPLKY
jgi:hypothetical protein